MSDGGFAEQAVAAADGVTIAARFFAPADGAPVATAVIVPAMGVAQGYYRSFAAWLAAQGYLVVTFDYRGTGRSRTGRLRGFAADVSDWARLDCAAVLEAAAARAGDRPLIWIGHSLGGQILPMVPNRERVAKVVAVATGSGYWRRSAPRMRLAGWWLWYIAVPVATRLFGYFPGRRLGKVGDLPRGVIEQWRRWCLNEDYAVGAEGGAMRERYAAVTTPIVALSFTDDAYMSAANTQALLDFYANAPQRHARIAPADVGRARIGHFGFFRPTREEALWRTYLLPALSL